MVWLRSKANSTSLNSRISKPSRSAYSGTQSSISCLVRPQIFFKRASLGYGGLSWTALATPMNKFSWQVPVSSNLHSEHTVFIVVHGQTVGSAQANWSADPGQLSFRLLFRFGCNETHWFLSQIRLQTNLFSATAMWLPTRSGDHRVQRTGHAVAALKGKPFECHYIELPFIVDDLQVKGRSVSIRHAVESVNFQLGDTAGLLIMEDFLMSGWEESASMRPTNRLNVEPCGLRLCGMQAMDRRATALEVQQWNSQVRQRARDAADGPEWRRYGQSHSYLPAIERVCGTKADVAAMQTNTAATLARNTVSCSIAGLAAWMLL
eukprot:jgi/Ulvmu1/12535/UM090_0022.1